jgi:hypothetical protein
LLKEQEEADRKDDDDEKKGGSPGVCNRSKQIERLQRQADRIEKFLKQNGPKIGKQGREIKSNITDNESAMMFSSHGIIQGYNGQALVDSKNQVIVHGEALGSAEDEHYAIPPMIDSGKENMEAIGQSEDYFEEKTFTADSNYHSPTNLKKCDEEKLDAYIPDKRFRKRDARYEVKERSKPGDVKLFTVKDFQYNEEADEYLCPNGKFLKLNAKKAIIDGVIYRRYVADREQCKGCELRVKCIRRKNAKRRTINIAVGHVPGNLTKAMAAKIDSEKGRRIYPRRIAIVEPVFANIQTHKGMSRFTLRGKIKVNIQWLLYCMIHNIGKILRYGFNYGFS